MFNKFIFIIAILAAVLVPAMLGYVKKAQSVSENNKYIDYEDYEEDFDDYE